MSDDNTGLGLIKASIERVQKNDSLFHGALKILVNLPEIRLANFLAAYAKKIDKSFFRLISNSDNPPIVEACDGSDMLIGSVDIFTSGVLSNFDHLRIDKPAQPTESTAAQVYDITSRAIFVEVFGSVGPDLEQLCWTQHQIYAFCKYHGEWFYPDGRSTFFLFKAEDCISDSSFDVPTNFYFVADVYMCNGGLRARIRGLYDDARCDVQYNFRVVVPQILAA
jgi:hypothetical protein